MHNTFVLVMYLFNYDTNVIEAEEIQSYGTSYIQELQCMDHAVNLNMYAQNDRMRNIFVCERLNQT